MNLCADRDGRKSSAATGARAVALAPGEHDATWLPAGGSISRHPPHDKATAPQAPQRAPSALPQREGSERSELPRRAPFNTLAQPYQNSNVGVLNPLNVGEKLRRRARSKYFSKPLATALAENGKLVGSPLEKSYRNTIYCNATLSQDGGKLVGHYCGNRWCITCSRIRTALAMNRYRPVLATWRDRQLVTLTLRNVPAVDLDRTVDEMFAGFTAAHRAITRTDRQIFKALRKLEETYNRVTDEYHPHFHVVVEGRRAAELLVSRWLKYFPDRTDARGQDIRSADDDASLSELFKYFTKLVTKSQLMPPAALDIMFRSMRGRRVYQPVGFTLPKEAPDDEGELAPDEGTAAISRPSESITWEWEQSATDWIDRETGECLTGYEPREKFRQLVESIGNGSSAHHELRAPRLLPAALSGSG